MIEAAIAYVSMYIAGVISGVILVLYWVHNR